MKSSVCECSMHFLSANDFCNIRTKNRAWMAPSWCSPHLAGSIEGGAMQSGVWFWCADALSWPGMHQFDVVLVVNGER
jgi:hypothetical protein